MDNRFRGLSCLMALVAAAACVPICAQEEIIPVHTVLEKLPDFVHMDMQQNVLAFATGSKIHVYDLDTGKRRWWKPSTYEGKHFAAIFSKDYVAMYGGEQLVALDMATGNELWQKEMDNGKHIEHGYFYNDSNWLQMKCQNGTILYNMDTQKGYQIPFGDNFRGGMMPDGKTLYEIRRVKSASSATHDVLFWKPGDLQPEKRFSLESPGEALVWGVSGNEFLISDYIPIRTPERILRTYDGSTGAIIHEFDPDLVAAISTNNLQPSRDEGCLFWLDDKEPRQLHKMDIFTGNTCAMAFPEGFTLLRRNIKTDTVGNWWFLAWDKDFNLFLLPFNHDATPRKLLDGSRFLPSYLSMLHPPYLFTHLYAEENIAGIFRLDNMQLLAEWPGNAQYLRISKDIQYGALVQYEEDGHVRVEKAYLYNREKEEPLLKVKGSPLAVSPDGRYLVIKQNKGSTYSPSTGTAHVIDVTTKKPVISFDSIHSAFSPVFSEDGRYLALCHSGILKILDIEAGFAENILFVPDKRTIYANSISFSPDSKRLLTSERSQAIVFDVATGRHIRSFKETAQVVPDYEWKSSNPGFLKTVENTVRDFAGLYTDRLKEKRIPAINAKFSKNGAQVVTVAENRLIRVWDTETGRLIRTIDPKLPETRNADGSIGNIVKLSGDGAYALTYNKRGLDAGTLWDLEKGTKIRCYTFQGTQRMSAALSEDGTRVYALIDGDLHFLSGASEKKESLL